MSFITKRKPGDKVPIPGGHVEVVDVDGRTVCLRIVVDTSTPQHGPLAKDETGKENLGTTNAGQNSPA